MAKKRFEILGRRTHSKASEEYLKVSFLYGSKSFEWDIPIEYRRTGTHLADSSEEDLIEYLEDVYEKCDPKNWRTFREEQDVFWADKSGATVTRSFFDVLASDFTWKSVVSDLPQNPNWARRIQDLKEMGYTIATRTSMLDSHTRRNVTHLLLVPLPRGGITGYETWTPAVRKRIIELLDSHDAYECKKTNKDGLLPDHKFPEIRWDEKVRRADLSELSDEEIREDFQLLTNQRNLQKREVCRTCYQTGKRGFPYGIAFFYHGSSDWDLTIPRRGVEAAAGCIGCGWYDLEAWRKALNEATKDT
jgi:hypothetical protein